MDIFPNSTVLFQWFLFMTALFALHLGVFRPTLHLIQERRLRTSGEREKAEELLKRVGLLSDQYEKKMAEARLIGIQEKEERLRNGGEVARDHLREARQRIDSQLEKLRQSLEAQGLQVSLQLKQHAQELGQAIAVKIIGRSF